MLPTEAPPSTRVVEVRNRDYFVLAPEAGLFEPLVALGDTVEAGDACGQVHFVDNPGREAVMARFRTSGTVISQRHFGRVERGDCVAHLATDWKGSGTAPVDDQPPSRSVQRRAARRFRSNRL